MAENENSDVWIAVVVSIVLSAILCFTSYQIFQHYVDGSAYIDHILVYGRTDSESQGSGVNRGLLFPHKSERDGDTESSEFIKDSNSIFVAALGDGLNIKMHAKGKCRQVEMKLEGGYLKWKVLKSLTQRKFRISIRDLRRVVLGCEESTHWQNGSLDNNLCFSIVCHQSILSFETASLEERDLLAHGFSDAIFPEIVA